MSIESFKVGIANDLETALIRVVPVDKGSLRQSIKVITQGDTLYITMLYYGIYIEYGTLPHIIRPKDKKSLKFKVKDGSKTKEVFAKEVHHPGTKAFPFIRNTFIHKLPDIVSNNARIHLGDPNAAEVVF